MNPLLINRAYQAMTEGDFVALQNLLIGQLSFRDALPVAWNAWGRLSNSERNRLWSELHRQDRLAGILQVVDQLAMPQFHAFGSGTLSQGDVMTDYDEARWFIVNKRSELGLATALHGYFYPEVMFQQNANQRILELARSHIGCSPDGKRQLILFTCAGRYRLSDARILTKKATTCGSFLRSILLAAGDTRIGTEMLEGASDQVNMSYALGGATAGTRGWIAFSRAPTPPLLMTPGDPYFIQLDRANQESGHVGVIEDVQTFTTGGRQILKLTTIDGGERPGGSLDPNKNDHIRRGAGIWTFPNVRTFSRSAVDPSALWYQQEGHLSVPNKSGRLEQRLFFGYLDASTIPNVFIPHRLPVAGGAMLQTRL